MLEIQGITKKFKQHTAVDGLSLTVSEGEVFALLGPNGAGKTTTLNLILGFEKADQGTIKVDGYDVVKDLSEVRKRLAFIPENVQLYPHLSGKENLAYFSQLAGIHYSQDQLKDLLLEAGLQEKLMPLLYPPIRKACVKKLALPSPTPKRPNYSFWMNQQVAWTHFPVRSCPNSSEK